MSDTETLAIYDAKAGEYAALEWSETEMKSLRDFLADLPENPLVLDLGCGPGNFARDMVRLGCRVDAVDGSAEMVALASQIEGVTAWQAFFEEINVEDAYDAVWANFSLLHAPRADLPAHLARLKRALKEGGVFHIGMKLGDSEARDKLGRRYTYVEEGELKALLQGAGLTPYNTQRGEGVGLDGSVAEYILVRARG